jgi:hypothetical protein
MTPISTPLATLKRERQSLSLTTAIQPKKRREQDRDQGDLNDDMINSPLSPNSAGPSSTRPTIDPSHLELLESNRIDTSVLPKAYLEVSGALRTTH